MEKYHRTPLKDYISVSDFAGNEDFDIAQPETLEMKREYFPFVLKANMPTEAEIKTILREMGKTKPEQELNCASCGYNTCREKAIAIYQGKAEISMCLPFLKERAEGFSDIVVKHSPNAIIVLNDMFEVQQINAAAQRIMNLRSPQDVLGDQVARILDPSVFMQVRTSGKGVYDQRIYLAEYNRFVEQTVVPAEGGRMMICIMRDVTDEERANKRREAICHETVEVADRVVDKQMRIVQEIASLLGETAAETKIALTKLKESISDE